ncbi:MAG TPA: universal stress protein [Methylomirabilota bacterium]|nr:universal stress protein [Methylomirabilota bacterium]
MESGVRVFRRILHATDLSRASRPALVKAIALARQNRARLLIAYALPPLVVPTGADLVSPGTYEAIDRSTREHARKRIAALVQRAKQAGARATGLLLDGSPDEQVPRAARRHRADLIVIGTHGRTGLSKVLLGSVAERLVRVAPSPVLTIRSR